MDLSADLLALLRCPSSRQALTVEPVAPADQPARWSELSAAFGIAAPAQRLVAADRSRAYPVWADVIGLEASLAVAPDAAHAEPGPLRRAEKQVVADFYDRYGWTRDGDAPFRDALAFEDLRPVTAAYRRRCNARIARGLGQGRYLLDAASGAVQLQDYVEFSRNFTTRVCLDLSLRGLLEAKRRLGAHALCVLGDITALPFADGVMDAFVSVHTVYHVPADEQAGAIAELYRVLKPAGRGVVVYSWGAQAPLLKRYAPLVERRKAHAAQDAPPALPDLYFHPRDHAWYQREIAARYPVRLRVWRSVEKEFLATLVRSRWSALLLLAPLWLAEELMPERFGRLGIGPMFVFAKPAA